jgi:hypothetical protein
MMIEPRTPEKRKLELSGIVDAYGWDSQGNWPSTSPVVGGVRVIDALEETFGAAKSRVRVWLGVEALASGKLWTCHGFAGTDVTPAESPEISVGDIDVLDRLRDLDEREVVLIIEDE